MSESEHDELIARFLEITGTSSTESAKEILISNNWNIQTAIATIFNDSTLNSERNVDESEERRGLMEEMEIDDSLVMPSSGSGGRNNGGNSIIYILKRIFAVPITILTWPAGILYNLVGLLARLLRFRPPSLRPRNPFSGPQTRFDPTAAAERWLRALEESTKAVRYSRRNDDSSNSTSIASGSNGTGLIQRVSRGERKVVPDFLVMGYSDALAKAKREIKILLVVLTCEEHDDDLEFKQTVLADAEFCKVLNNQGILIWGGDVRDRDAYQVAKTLQYFSLPFIGFIALLQPRSGSSTASPRMTIISRLEGSPTTTTSAASIIAHISTVVLPTVTPYHNRMRVQEVSRTQERNLRAEQDRNAERVAQVDIEKVLKKREEEDKRNRDLELSLRTKEEENRKERSVIELNLKREEWKSYARINLLNDEPIDSESELVRIGVMLGDGRRIIRKFRGTESIKKVYCWVECSLDLPLTSPTSDPSTPLSLATAARSINEPKNYTHIYEFRLATTFPRIILEIDGFAGEGLIEQVLGKSGNSINLVVEGLEKRRMSMGESSEEDLEGEEEEEV